jgi:1-acyl-sn-glycerol-3-phosphate acyltransferase
MKRSGKIFRSRWNLSRVISQLILKVMGWKTRTISLDFPKFILIGAHHTSNWDFIIGYLVMTAIGLNFRFVGKHTLFRWPLGSLMRRLGGIAVNRSLSTNFVEQVVSHFQEQEQLIVAIAPEGTRRQTDYWRSGFYYIALQANVPVVLGFLDYRTKTGGLGAMFYPSGNLEKDLELVREFYAGIHGKHPEKAGTIRFQPRA